MTVDEQIGEAAARLATVPVAVPELGRLVRRHRRRSLAAGGALALVVVVALVVVAVVGTGPERHPDRVEIGTAEVGPPPSGAMIGLADGMGVWPGEDRRFATADELGRAFAREVLGWVEAEVSVDPTDPRSPTGLDISNGAGPSVRAVAAPLQGAWTFMQIGVGSGMSAQVGSPDTELRIPAGPPGTASVRWWALLDGREVTGARAGRAGTLVLPAPVEHVGAVVVVYLDDQQAALEARAGSFGVPAGQGLAPTVAPGTAAGVR
jgi:hypothetical protein